MTHVSKFNAKLGYVIRNYSNCQVQSFQSNHFLNFFRSLNIFSPDKNIQLFTNSTGNTSMTLFHYQLKKSDGSGQLVILYDV